MITKTKRYLVTTTGLTGIASYQATDPDEALLFAHRYEIFLRLKRNQPDMSIEHIRMLTRDEDCEIPDFKIESCILEVVD